MEFSVRLNLLSWGFGVHVSRVTRGYYCATHDQHVQIGGVAIGLLFLCARVEVVIVDFVEECK